MRKRLTKFHYEPPGGEPERHWIDIEQIATVERAPSTLSYGLLKLHPYWDPLHGDPRFHELVRQMNFPLKSPQR